MENLILKETDTTPYVCLNAKTFVFEIKGESRPEYVLKFYTPLFDWLKELFNKNNSNSIELNIELEYFNSSSAKCLFDLISLINTYSIENNSKFTVIWSYSEFSDDILESGKELEKLTKANFTFNKVN
jgi:hypothetical protein